MDGFFAKKGLTVTRNYPPPQPYHYNRNPISNDIGSGVNNSVNQYPTATTDPTWMSTNYQTSNASFLRAPQGSFDYGSKHNSSQLGSFQTPYTNNTNKQQSRFPHRRNASQLSNQNTSYQDFKTMQIQNSSAFTEDKTPKNYLFEENTSLLSIMSHKKKDEGEMRPVSTGSIGLVGSNVGPREGQPTKIKQIKEELLNQGRRDKEINHQEDIVRRTPPMYPSSVKNIKETASASTVTVISATTQPNTGGSSVSSNVVNSGASSTYWIDQKIKLLRQIEEKEKKVTQLEKKLTLTQQEYKAKVVMAEHDKRQALGLKNRLQLQLENTRRLLKVERGRNDQSQQKMNKMMFFEDDLIHAKDYSRLKREMEEVLRENAEMFQDHQKYILQVAQGRRQMTNRVEELQVELSKLRAESFKWKEKMEILNTASDDKVKLIKLQNQVNFMIKKSEENLKALVQQEGSLEKACLTVKQLTEKQNRRTQTQKNWHDGLNLQQMNNAIIRYQSRLADMSQILEQKQRQLDKQNKLLEYYSGEMMKNREDTRITSMKERSHENSLKNQLQTLRLSMQSDIDLQSKKVKALEEKVDRKGRELLEKDRFIKQFLLRRVRDIEGTSFEELVKIMRGYFVPQELKESKETRESKDSDNSGKETVVEERQKGDKVEVKEETSHECQINSESEQENSKNEIQVPTKETIISAEEVEQIENLVEGVIEQVQRHLQEKIQKQKTEESESEERKSENGLRVEPEEQSKKEDDLKSGSQGYQVFEDAIEDPEAFLEEQQPLVADQFQDQGGLEGLTDDL